MNVNNTEQKTAAGTIRQVALTAMLFALAIALTIAESFIPVPAPIPGIRLGLSNIVVMFSLFFLRFRYAFAIAVLKSLFVFITRGAVAGALSLAGGLFSICVMVLLILVFKNKISWLLISISGAVFHNIGQLTVASVILGTPLWFYAPFLLLFGIIAGSATSILLRVSMPVFKKMNIGQ